MPLRSPLPLALLGATDGAKQPSPGLNPSSKGEIAPGPARGLRGFSSKLDRGSLDATEPGPQRISTLPRSHNHGERHGNGAAGRRKAQCRAPGVRAQQETLRARPAYPPSRRWRPEGDPNLAGAGPGRGAAPPTPAPFDIPLAIRRTPITPAEHGRGWMSPPSVDTALARGRRLRPPRGLQSPS